MNPTSHDSDTLLPIILATVLVITGTAIAGADEQPPWTRDSYHPGWAQAKPQRTKRVDFDRRASERENGAALALVIQKLRPGERLEIGPGRYELASKLTIDHVGTAASPIWIEAADPESPPTITRPDANQNLINVGERSPCRYLCLRHLELTGGSVVIRFYDCENVWLDHCELHHGRHGGITVNTRDTSHMYITHNHMHDFTSGTGEAMYLGANHGKVTMRDSVIAGNHVHDCGGEQGDGIELKQGSFNNWIVANHVHDTQYPCIISYGTAGKGINVIENNICYRSGDNTMQVQGEAIVRNNLIMAAGGSGFASTDHQGKTRMLQVVHNTIVTTGRGVNLSSWNDRQGMVFANNAVYSRRGPGIRFPSGSERVTFTGNVVFGGVEGVRREFVNGQGLTDFVSVSWDGNRRDATPSNISRLLGAADKSHAPKSDLRGRNRVIPPTAGAFAR